MTRVKDFDTIVTAFRSDDYLGVDSATGGTAAITTANAAAEIRDIETGTATPTANAAFVGQWFVKTNATIGAWIGVQVGAGSADWLKVWTSAADIPNSSITNAMLAGSIDASTKVSSGTVTNALLATGIDGAKLTAASVPTSALVDTPITSPLAANLDANDKEIDNAILVDSTVKQATVAISSGTVTIPFDGVKTVTLNANVTTFTFSGLPASGSARGVIVELIQDGTGGRTVSGWNSAIKWADNDTVPTITSTANKMDILYFYTRDGGSKIRGCVIGQNTTP